MWWLRARPAGGCPSTGRALESILCAVNAEEEASYVCPSCGEEILVLVDTASGDEQEYVEDCPVCCRPNLLSIQLRREGAPSVHARPE